MATLSASITQGCAAGAGVLTLTAANPAPGASDDLSYAWTILDAAGTDYGGAFDGARLPVDSAPLPDGTYQVRVRADENAGSGSYFSLSRSFTVACAGTGTPGALHLDGISHTDETPALGDGTATIQASGGTAPRTATLTGPTARPSQPATAGAPVAFTGLAPGGYELRVTDAAGTAVAGTVEVLAYAAPVIGCTDEYADNYDPEATTAGACSYTPNWRSAWGPTNVAVRVGAVPGQVPAYSVGLLRIGFRAGHPLADARPLGAAVELRATVGPDGYATFRLGPYLRSALGAADEAGGYRLDLNSPTAYDADLYVGYELRRPDGELLSHGYALNAAVPDEWIIKDPTTNNSTLLSPFGEQLPVWPGFDAYGTTELGTNGGFGLCQRSPAHDWYTIALPCPTNPLPVAWLAPGGGYGYWVFQGRPQLGDDVGDGQRYNEATSGERRWSSRGESRRTVTASSGVFKGVGLMEGLRTLWRSPQVWYRPVAGGPWVAVTIEPGSFPAGRLGVLKQQVSISFTEAQASYAQGQ